MARAPHRNGATAPGNRSRVSRMEDQIELALATDVAAREPTRVARLTPSARNVRTIRSSSASSRRWRRAPPPRPPAVGSEARPGPTSCRSTRSQRTSGREDGCVEEGRSLAAGRAPAASFSGALLRGRSALPPRCHRRPEGPGRCRRRPRLTRGSRRCPCPVPAPRYPSQSR